MDIKPCPFCGSYYVIPAGGRMICDACYAFGPPQRDDLFAAWNRRAPDPRAVELARSVHALRTEVNCRIEHGADSGGHLEYVMTRLDAILRESEGRA